MNTVTCTKCREPYWTPSDAVVRAFVCHRCGRWVDLTDDQPEEELDTTQPVSGMFTPLLAYGAVLVVALTFAGIGVTLMNEFLPGPSH